MDVPAYNRRAWDRLVHEGNRWTRPASEDEVKRARTKSLQLLLTPTKPVPMDWFPPLDQLPTLCLAAGGGQQAPLLAAAGADVTVLDNSPAQLAQDRLVADRERLDLGTVQGEMTDLSAFSNDHFGLIFHPCSNSFIPDVLPVWRECYRVLRPGGVLLSGFTNALRYLFDDERKENGNLEVRYSVPYSDLNHLSEDHIEQLMQQGKPLEFGHTLEDQIGGQLDTGLMITAMYEDRYTGEGDPISDFIATFIATRSVKPSG